MAHGYVIDYEELGSDHPGWKRYSFEWEGRQMMLLTIDREDDRRSQIYEDRSSVSVPLDRQLIGSTLVFEGLILTPRHAYHMLSHFGAYEERGVQRGRREAQLEVRRAIGL